MKIINGIHHIKRYPSPVVAIGVFDGVHVGHAAILKRCVRQAQAINGTSIVLTFCPHPQGQESIYSVDHRLAIIGGFGIQVCILVRFNRSFAKMTAQDFITGIIHRRIGARRVLVGKNFVFGKGGEGTISLLRRCGQVYGYQTIAFPIRAVAGRPVSSTRIREYISAGRFIEAQRLLGRKVSLLGIVIAGRRIGRSLGYPTANIMADHEVLPPDGIYAVKALISGSEISGICYKGIRPTFGGDRIPSIEVHLFGFTGNAYGKKIEVRFFKKIRGDRKFASAAELQCAIKKDIAAAKKILSSGR
jgi:riboflavin kinase / FMN adenylyltransferase